MSGHSEEEQALRFMLGLAPARLQVPYLVDKTRVDFKARKAPSTGMACELCAGFAGTYALKILLNRGDVPVAPRGVHFDAYRNKLTTTWRPWGNQNPVQQLGLMIARKIVMSKTANTVDEVSLERPVERILDLARWAPSGDNEQPWQFEIVDDSHFLVHTRDTRDWCVYDLDGTSSQIAVGALLESIAISATGEGMRAEFSRRADTAEESLLFEVRLKADESITPDALLPFIKARVTQRKPFSTRALSQRQKQAMEQSAGEGYRVVWVEGRGMRWQMAKLLFRSAHIRLTTPEAFEVHRKNIEWGVSHSESRIPEHALGADFLTRKIMRWGLQSWHRIQLLNRFLAGTWLPRLQMDLLPGFSCAAHFIIVADKPVKAVDDWVAGGRAMQRFWLEATRQGLQFQPEMTPLIFSRYAAEALSFTQETAASECADRLAMDLNQLLGPGQDTSRRVFMGRVGFGPAPVSRSVRLPSHQLQTEQ